MRLYVISVRMRANAPFTKFSEVFHAWIRCVCECETAIKTSRVNFNRLKIFLHCDPQHKPETKAHRSPLAALKNVPLPSASSIELASSLSSLPAARSTAAAECVATQAPSVSPRHFPIALLYSRFTCGCLLGAKILRSDVGKRWESAQCVYHTWHTTTQTHTHTKPRSHITKPFSHAVYFRLACH